MKKLPVIILSILLAISIIGHAFQYVYNMWSQNMAIGFADANSRNTYFTIHHVAEAHKISKGEGIKVGILDWGFGFLDHHGLYAGGLDFSGNIENFNYISEHGYWMANTLKEIAPGCEIYALGTFIPNSEEKWVTALIKALDWSIENGIDILTLSHQQITQANRARFDEAANKAIEHGIVTTFILYDNPQNLLPYGLFDFLDEYQRTPDINIYHYDYNLLFTQNYFEYKEHGPDASYIPYLSMSSMSPVTAGFVAILKSVNNTLTPAEYKQILIETSYFMHFDGSVTGFEASNVPRVADISQALRYLQTHYE